MDTLYRACDSRDRRDESDHLPCLPEKVLSSLKKKEEMRHERLREGHSNWGLWTQSKVNHEREAASYLNLPSTTCLRLIFMILSFSESFLLMLCVSCTSEKRSERPSLTTKSHSKNRMKRRDQFAICATYSSLLWRRRTEIGRLRVNVLNCDDRCRRRSSNEVSKNIFEKAFKAKTFREEYRERVLFAE